MIANMFQKNDKVIMKNCAGAKAYPNKEWTCSSDEFLNKKGQMCVTLYGVNKYVCEGFLCANLQKVCLI